MRAGGLVGHVMEKTSTPVKGTPTKVSLSTVLGALRFARLSKGPAVTLPSAEVSSGVVRRSAGLSFTFKVAASQKLLPPSRLEKQEWDGTNEMQTKF